MDFLIAGQKRKKSSSRSSGSVISSSHMEQIIDKYRLKRIRQSTTDNYIAVWRLFNKFLIRRDRRPTKWEDSLALYCAYLIENGNQSSTVKSYVSAIKSILKDDGYSWNENTLLISSLTRACKLVNDSVRCRLPIQSRLLDMILFETHRYFGSSGQIYLQKMYKALFSLAYYGMM